MKTETLDKKENLSPNEWEKLQAREFAKNHTGFLTDFFNSALPEAQKRTIESQTRDNISKLKNEIA
jgi:hypothetical protein